MRHTVRPLTDSTWLRPGAARVLSPFDTTWSKTLELLEREVTMLGASEFVLGLQVTEGDIRLDRQIRANARAKSPAVEVALTSPKQGPLLYRCDQFTARYHGSEDWHHNARAIAKTLEMLRAIERYGAADSGEQYTGFRQIAAAPAVPADRAAADLIAARWDLLFEAAQVTRVLYDVSNNPEHRRIVIDRARRNAHPDRGGSIDLWQKVCKAAQEVT